MAFYAYRGDGDECYWTPYSTSHDRDFGSSPVQAYTSPHELGEPELMIDYESPAYYKDDSYATPWQLNSSLCSYSEPRVLQYDQPQCHRYYSCYDYPVNPSETNYSIYNHSGSELIQYEPRFSVSYSTAELNEPEFEEYNPNPYRGGYDPATTYGSPLPPSDIICYPRSVPQSDSIFSENFSYNSIPSPYVNDDDLPTEPKKDGDGHDEVATDDGAEGENVEQLSMVPVDDPPCYDESWFGNGMRGDYDNQSPYGSGLEAVDLCESIFGGYWPCCLAKRDRLERREDRDQERRRDPWETAADYLFGSPGPAVYEYQHYHHHAQAQQQAQYGSSENPWLHIKF